MDAINSWQAVITQLGGGHDSAAAKTAVQHALHARTPAAASAVLGGKEVFYTPLSAVQQGTPVDAWHSILTTLTGNAKAAQGRAAGARGSTCSSMAGSPRASAAAGQPSPHGSPGMVRQLFTSTPGSFRPERGTSSTGSTPRHLLAHAQLHLRQPAGAATYTADRPAPGSPSSSPRNLSTAGPGYAERVSPFQRTLAATRQQDSPPRGMSHTQQLSDRLDALRASAESILNSVTSAAGSPAGRYPGSAAGSPCRSDTAAAARCSPRSGGGRSLGALTASSAPHAAQDASLPRKLFPSTSNPGPRRSAAAGSLSSPLQRLLQSAQMSREAAAAASSLSVGQAAAAAAAGAAAGSRPSYAGQQQSNQQVQSQQPLQQQLTGAVSKVDQLLAAMAERQRSSAGGSSIVQPPHTGNAATASVTSQQPQHTPQLQQQEMLQQLLLQQQQLINQLLPLIPKPDQPQPRGSVSFSGGAAAAVPAGGSAAADMVTTGTAGNPVSRGSHGFPQHQLASLLQAAARVEELQAGRGSASPWQEGSALVIPLLSEPQPSPRMRPAAQQLQQAGSGELVVGTEAGGDVASGPGAGEQPAAGGTSTQGAVVRSSQAVQDQADRAEIPNHLAREAGGSSSSSSGRSSRRSSVADHEREQATGLVSSGSSAVGAAGGKSRRRRWHLPLPNGTVCASDAATAAAAHASVPQQQSQNTDAHPSVDSSKMDGTAIICADGEAVRTHAGPAAGADSANRHWSAAGSKSMPAVGTKPEPGLPDHHGGRFLSQGPSRTAHANSNLAHQLGLPQVVRFSGGTSMNGAADAAAGAQKRSSSGRAVSSDGSSRGSDAAPGDTASTSCDRAVAEAAESELSGRGQSEPGTPTAALPRVHTPGKPAAEVAAELSTPQLAHSAAAVMTVSEAWREEASGTQARWQQLLAEWSASEVDTWEPQRLTEPSTLTAQHSRMSSAPGLNLSQPASQGEEHQHHGHAQQQQQDAAAGAAGSSVQVAEGGLRHSRAPEGDHAGAQQQQQGQAQQQQAHEQVTFARLAKEHDLSPRKIPSTAALQPAAESTAVTAGAAVEADASEASLFCTVPQQQQQQQQQEAQQEAEPQPPSPAWPDTTRKQLFTSAAADDSSSSMSSSRELGATATSDAIAAAAAAAAAAEAACTAAQPSSGAVSAAAPARAAVSDAGAVAQQQQMHTDKQQQQQQLEQQEEEGLERLNQLLHDLQGLQHRLQGMQLQTPRQTLQAKGAGPAASASQSASVSNQSARSRSPFSSAAAAAAAAAVVGVAAASSTLLQQHSSSAVTSYSAGSGSVSAEGAAVTPLQAAPASAADARAASAVGRISSLKQRLQDSRAALQAITVQSAGDSSDLQQQASATAAGALSQGSLRCFVRSGGESASVASSSHSGSAAGPVTADARAGGASTAAAPAASAWLTGGPLQQYLERRSSTGRVSSTGLGAGSSGTLGSMGSALPAVSDRQSGRTVLTGGGSAGGSSTSSSHVQALVSKWRAAATAQQEAQAAPSTLLQQQQQQQQHGGKDDAGLSTLQAMLARVRTGGPAATDSASEVVAGAAAHSSPLPQWLSSGVPGSHLQQLITSRSGGGAGTTGSHKMPPAAPVVVTPLGQRTPLQGALGTKTVGGGRGSTGPRNTGSSIQAGPGAFGGAAGGAWSIHNPLYQQTPVSMPPVSSSRRTDCYSSGSRNSTRSGVFTGMASGSAGSSARAAARCSSTPPSAGNLARWTQQGSPTRQLRQQLQAAAQQFQLQEQERHQQYQAAVQVTPVSANLAKSFATLDRTLAGLKSVSPPAASAAAAAATGRNASAAPPAPTYVLKTPSGLSLSSSRNAYSGGSYSSAGGRAAASAGRCSGRSAAEILAGTAAAAEATRSSLATGKAQAAAVRSVSPVQMLRRQQEMLASIGMLSKPPSQERAFGFGPWQ